MPPLARAAAGLAALLVVANCAETQTTQMTRNAPVPTEAIEPVVKKPSGTDLACLAEAIYFEARGTGTTGETAVAHVVVNRAKSPKFGPRTVCGVVADGCQFSYRCDGRSDALNDPRSRAKAFKIAETVLAGAPDITRARSSSTPPASSPGWFSSRPRVGTFGGNVFYR